MRDRVAREGMDTYTIKATYVCVCVCVCIVSARERGRFVVRDMHITIWIKGCEHYLHGNCHISVEQKMLTERERKRERERERQREGQSWLNFGEGQTPT